MARLDTRECRCRRSGTSISAGAKKHGGASVLRHNRSLQHVRDAPQSLPHVIVLAFEDETRKGIKHPICQLVVNSGL